MPRRSSRLTEPVTRTEQFSTSISGSTLTITLKNTATSAANEQPAPTDGLAGVLFRLPTGSLQAQAALIPSGNAIVQANKCDNASCAGATDVGGEVALQGGSICRRSGTRRSQRRAGLERSNAKPYWRSRFDDRFRRTDPLSAVRQRAMGLKKDALTQSSVTFALTIVGGTLLENQITNWSVVFGTAWGEGTVGEPGH